MKAAICLLSAVPVLFSGHAWAADRAPAPQPPLADTATSKSGSKPPLIVHNPDGTFTIQKPASKNPTSGTDQKGLVITPQVVVPVIPSKDDK